MNAVRPLVVIAVAASVALAQVAIPASPSPAVQPTSTATPNPVSGPTPAAADATTQNETTVTLDLGFGTRPVLPSRVTVPLGEKLRIVAPDMGAGVNYIWTKNGRAIPGAADSYILTINHVISDDAGVYACSFSTPTTLPRPSQMLVLGIGPTDRLLNLSTRGIVGSAPDAGLTTGFAVAANSGGKKLILRAVGPSLAAFGVANPLRQPILRIYDSSGNLYDNGYAYPAVVGGLTYEADLAGSLSRAGAFPLPGGTLDVTEMKPFLPGTYTATVTSGDGSSGAVLLEIYEVP